MEKAKVYFSDLRTSPTSNLLDKMERLLKRAGIGQLPLQDSFTAIKIHFGEPGNLAYIRPNYAARMAQFTPQFRSQTFPDRLQHPIFRPPFQCSGPSAKRNGERVQSHIRPMPGDYCRRSQRYGLQGNTDRRRILPDSQDRHRYRRCGHHNQHEPL